MECQTHVWSGPMEEHVTFAIIEFRLHVLSLVQTTIGFGKPCRTRSPVYHMRSVCVSCTQDVVFGHVFGIKVRGITDVYVGAK